MFTDRAEIYLKAGNGGNGIVSFRREKYVAAGGPDGGDGGKGGDVIFAVDEGVRTLRDFKLKRHYKAEPGQDGGPCNRSGKSGNDLEIRIPAGTLVIERDTGRIIADMTIPGSKHVVVKGGKGGKGNQHFATSTRQVPSFSKMGEEGEELWVKLELKLLADVGLIGYPNVGKSTILSAISSARPKIADYHFTTLEPNLGVVYCENGNSFVVADIPGLIEGAHEGAGLGHEFLRHVERTRLLIHVVDIAAIEGRNPIEDFETINLELSNYDKRLAQRPQVIAANKTDILQSPEVLDEFIKEINKSGYSVFPISAVTGKGVKELVRYVEQKLANIPETIITDADDTVKVYTAKREEPLRIVKDGEIYVISGSWIDKLMHSVNFDDNESLQYFQRAMKTKGVIKALEKKGINEGDTVRVGNIEFEYIR